MPTTNNSSKEFFIKHRGVLVGLFLVAATLAAYWQVPNHDFVNFDDNDYIYENRHVQNGSMAEKIVWAFTAGTRVSNYWHPLTWISHILDVQLFGLNAGGHHLTSLLFHILNTLLLFFVFKIMTGHLWQSGFLAALFALHPIHVESVAWVAERKDVLSTFFWLLTMWAYLRYVEKPGFSKYFIVLLFFVMGLMSKPMLVTLPFVLFLMDFWPLGRLQLGQEINRGRIEVQKSSVFHLTVEKIPFFAISAVASFAAYVTQRKGGAVQPISLDLITVQTANAIVSYIKYIAKMIWPGHLAAYYPHPGMLPVWKIVGAGLLIASLSVFFGWMWRRFPPATFGWFWFLGTFVPVIGLVKIGDFAMADRYTYVPLIGLFVVVAWGVPEIAAQWRHRKMLFAALATTLLFSLMAATRIQVGYWADSIKLFEHALAVTSDNWLAHNNLGAALSAQNRIDEAMGHYLEALRIKPNYVDARNNLGLALEKQGRTKDAELHYLQVLRVKPNNAEAHFNLGNALINQGRVDSAVKHYSEALRIEPDHADAHNNLGKVLYKQGRIEDAVAHYLQALRIVPDYMDAHYNLGNAFYRQGRTSEALDHYLKALQIEPGQADLHVNIGAVLIKQGHAGKAIEHYLEALRIKPDHVDAHYNLGAAFFRKGDIKQAMYHFQEVLKINPADVHAQNNLKALSLKQQQK